MCYCTVLPPSSHSYSLLLILQPFGGRVFGAPGKEMELRKIEGKRVKESQKSVLWSWRKVEISIWSFYVVFWSRSCNSKLSNSPLLHSERLFFQQHTGSKKLFFCKSTFPRWCITVVNHFSSRLLAMILSLNFPGALWCIKHFVITLYTGEMQLWLGKSRTAAWQGPIVAIRLGCEVRKNNLQIEVGKIVVEKQNIENRGGVLPPESYELAPVWEMWLRLFNIFS